jgi:hypothetical protein
VSESADERRQRLSEQVPEWYREMLDPDDAEQAFTLGAYHLLHRGWVHASFARAWFAVAAEHAPVDMAWRIADEYVQWGDPRHANTWIRYALATEYRIRPGGVTVDPSLFALVIDHRGAAVGQDFGLQVISADNDEAEAALRAAAPRFALVTADGRELAAGQKRDGSLDPRDYVPNHVSAPEATPDGPTMWCDCKDGLMPLMARTMTRILVEEIRASGLDRAEIRPRPKP